MDWKYWIALLPNAIQAIVVSASALWAIKLYEKQKRDAFEASKQANRSLLTQSYMHWHAVILSSQKNIEISARLIRKSHDILAPGRQKIDSEQCHAIHVMYMLLNSLFLEYKYRRLYDPDMTGFDKSVEFAIGGLRNNTDRDFSDIATYFSDIFSDFPEDFKEYIFNKIENKK